MSPADVEAVVSWLSAIRIFAAVTGLLYALFVCLALAVYTIGRHPRIHRVFLGLGSGGVTMVLALRLWIYPAAFSAAWAAAAWAAFFLELVGLASVVVRDVFGARHT